MNTLALVGMFGEARQREATRFHNDVSSFLVLLSNNREAREIATRVFAHQIDKNPAGLIGRLLGMGLLAFVSYNRWWGRPFLSVPSKIVFGALNTIVATYGAGIWAASLGLHRDTDKMALLLLTGDVKAVQCLPSLENVQPDMRSFQRYDALEGAQGLTVATASFVQRGYSVFE